MFRHKSTLPVILFILAALVFPLSASAAGVAFPEVIFLPNGFRPEGIAVGKGHTFYTGSLGNGAIYRGDLRTGEGEVIFDGQAGRMAVGMSFDERSGYLFAAGGLTGQAFVFDGETGDEVAAYTLSSPFASFINDVIVTRQAAYFTNSFEKGFYRVPLGPGGGLPDPAEVQAIPLSGDFVQVPGAFVFNSNGIEASENGERLVIVNSARGELYRVDPLSGHADLIDLGGMSVSFGDGLLFRGADLFVVRNQLNQIAVVELDQEWSTGTVVDTLTNPKLRVPTTAAAFGNALYLVNARFDVANPTPDTEYEAVRVSLNH